MLYNCLLSLHCNNYLLSSSTSVCCDAVQCGFFKRNKPGDDGLYKAKMEKQRDFSDFD